MGLLTLRDMQFRRGRLIGIVGVIAVVMTLLFLMTGIVGQFNQEPYLAAERAGGGRDWVLAKGTSGPFTGVSTMPMDAMKFNEAEWRGPDPILVGRASIGGEHSFVIGRSHRHHAPPRLVGRTPVTGREVLVDESLGLAVGDTAELGSVAVTVVGVTSDATVLAGVPLVFTSLELAQDVIAGGAPIVSGGLIDPNSPLPDPEGSIGFTRMNSAEVGADARRPLSDAITSVDLVRALLWLITAIVIGATTFVSALERTREIAVLKAVGASGRRLGTQLVVQAVVLVIVAFAGAVVLQQVARPLFPLTVRIPARAWFQIPVVAVVVAAVAGIAGARRIAKTPPNEAFA